MIRSVRGKNPSRFQSLKRHGRIKLLYDPMFPTTLTAIDAFIVHCTKRAISFEFSKFSVTTGYIETHLRSGPYGKIRGCFVRTAFPVPRRLIRSSFSRHQSRRAVAGTFHPE